MEDDDISSIKIYYKSPALTNEIRLDFVLNANDEPEENVNLFSEKEWRELCTQTMN